MTYGGVEAGGTKWARAIGSGRRLPLIRPIPDPW
jgi:hypothetical protein